jgi:Fe-S cluster biogenesis protein NfuA
MSETTTDTDTAPVTVAVTGGGPDHERRVSDLLELIDVIRPAVEADGGTLHLKAVDTDTGDVTVELAGACGSCAVASLTLEGGITRILRQRLDWITEVHGEVEEDPDAVGWGAWTPQT